jgi:hypothetical protein
MHSRRSLAVREGQELAELTHTLICHGAALPMPRTAGISPQQVV